MGKSKKAAKYLKNICGETINEQYRPFLLHYSTYSILTDQILMLMPSQRNVLLSMNEYDLYKINPTHSRSHDSPSHIILFCIRFIANDAFQPIGGLLIYKQIDQSVILAECIKAYIHDLWKLNLHVVATISPPFKIFKDILGHLIPNKEFHKHSDVLMYSVEPIQEIIHIYDVQFLIINLQNLLQEGDIIFKSRCIREKILTACWEDISVIINTAPEFKIISDFLSSKESTQRRVHIFTEHIFIKYMDVKSQGLLSEYAEGCAELLNAVITFLKNFDYDFMYPPDYVMSHCSNLIYILSTMTFAKHKHISPELKINLAYKNEIIGSTKNIKNKNKLNIVPNESDNDLLSNYDYDLLRKTKSGCVEHNEILSTNNSKINNFDLKVALKKMDCNINLMNYGEQEEEEEEEVFIQDNNNVKRNKISKINKTNSSTKENYNNNNKTEEDIKRKVDYKKNFTEMKKSHKYEFTYTENCITQDFISTVKGINQLMSLMARRRVKQIKPDALIVEHIDYFVTKIQSTINGVDSVYYYGHAYKFMDVDLAFSTLSNTKGLLLISKD